ncbi:hypothetical protein V8F06_006086 [Rhypophila decipiens]
MVLDFVDLPSIQANTKDPTKQGMRDLGESAEQDQELPASEDKPIPTPIITVIPPHHLCSGPADAAGDDSPMRTEEALGLRLRLFSRRQGKIGGDATMDGGDTAKVLAATTPANLDTNGVAVGVTHLLEGRSRHRHCASAPPRPQGRHLPGVQNRQTLAVSVVSGRAGRCRQYGKESRSQGSSSTCTDTSTQTSSTIRTLTVVATTVLTTFPDRTDSSSVSIGSR